MDTIEAFFPYRDLFGPLKLAVTPWFVSFILMGFIFYSGRLYWRLMKLKHRVSAYLSDLDVEPPEDDHLLRKSWLEYQQTFLQSEEGHQKTIYDAAEFFGARTVLAKQVNLRFWAALPGLFLGIGILGTFLGLTLGIEGFDSSDPETIRTSIDGLLGGMSTAFLTSLYGMTVSLLFNSFEKSQLKQASDCIHDLCIALNQKYRLSQAEAIRSEDNRRWRVLRALLVDQKKDGDILPAHVLRDMLQNSDEQTKALKSFSTDLADGIMISSQTIEMMGDQIGRAIGSNLEKAIMPAISHLSEAVEELRNEKQESSGEFMARIVDNLGDTVTAALEQVQTTFTANTVNQMEELANAVATAGESFSSVPGLIEESMKNVREGMTAATQAFLEASQTAIDHLEQVVAQYTTTAEKTEKMFSAFNDTLAQLDDASESLQAGVDVLTSHMEVMRGSSETLERVTGSLEHHVQEFGDQQRNALDSLATSMQQAEDLVRTNASHIREVETGLSSVFGQIQDGLTAYRETTKESINDYLSSMAQESTSTIRSLAGCLEELWDVLDDIDSNRTEVRDAQ